MSISRYIYSRIPKSDDNLVSSFTAIFSCPPLPTFPTPPPQVTTDSKETQPITSQGPIITDELLDPLTTTTSQNDNNGGKQTGPLVTTIGAESREPTTSEASLTSTGSGSINISAIVGGIVGAVLVKILTLIVVIIISVVVRKKKCHSTSLLTTSNQTYGINDTVTCAEESAYDYPAVVDLDTTIDVKQNEAYSQTMNIVTTRNEAYATNICYSRK